MNLSGLVHRLGDFLYRQRVGWHNRRLAKRLARTTTYDFTSDWVSPHTDTWRNALRDYRGKPAVRMLEIGSCHGRSALWFLDQVLTGDGSTLTCVDPFYWRGLEPRFDHNLRLSGKAHQVVKMKGKSGDLLPGLPAESFDIVYVDGDHSAAGVLLDAMLSWRCLKPGGVLIFDDYLWEPQRPALDRPQLALDLFLEVLAGSCEALHRGSQVILRKAAGNGGG